MVEAVRMLARLEGVLLDPVYTGKAMAGLIGLVRARRVERRTARAVRHTGGAPVLHAYGGGAARAWSRRPNAASAHRRVLGGWGRRPPPTSTRAGGGVARAAWTRITSAC
jgi:hypothetical protein